MVLAIVYGYMLILQMFALYFAFQTRKIKVKGLNDAKYIAMIVYVVGILIIINVINTFALPKYVTVYAAIYSTCIWLSAAAVLGITFVPKVYPYRYKTYCIGNQINFVDGSALQ